MELQPRQQRVVTERDELKLKADALLKFLQTEGNSVKVSTKEWTLLKEQWDAMMIYYAILQERIALWNKA